MVNSSRYESEVQKSRWTWKENKQFEDCLVEFPDGCAHRWERIAARLRSRSAAEVEQHFAVLVDDVAAIDAGLIELPVYSLPKKSPNYEKQRTVQRKPAKPWTEKEHRLFLLGLENFGKGDWKSISRYAVLSRSPSQVASHAQKYYERQEKEEQKKKRRSIFDNSIAEIK